MKSWLIFSILGGIAIISAPLIFLFTSCEEVDSVTFGVQLEIAEKFKIFPQTTKVCKTANSISSIPQPDIDELIDLKVDLLRTVHNISTSGKEVDNLQRQISYILDIP